MNKYRFSNHRATGLTLVELLVAITLGAIILAGAVTLFVNNRDTYKTTNELSRLQETARYALGMMVKDIDIRMAGYFGCADRGDTVTLNVATATPGELWDINMDPGAGAVIPPIEGFEDAFPDKQFMPSGFDVTVGTNGDGGEILANTDAITLRYLAGSMNDTTGAAGTLDYLVTDVDTTSTITVDSTTGFAQNQVAAISDCGGSDIFQITAAPTATTMQANALSRGYNATSSPMIAPYVGVRYYIGDNGRGPGVEVYPSLYRTIIDPDANPPDVLRQELFEGVETMQILYGVDTSGNGVPDSYVRSGDAPLSTGDPDANWLNVVSVRISIMVRTIDQHGRDQDLQAHQVNDFLVPAIGDNRRRRVFTTTATVRNL